MSYQMIEILIKPNRLEHVQEEIRVGKGVRLFGARGEILLLVLRMNHCTSCLN